MTKDLASVSQKSRTLVFRVFSCRASVIFVGDHVHRHHSTFKPLRLHVGVRRVDMVHISHRSRPRPRAEPRG